MAQYVYDESGRRIRTIRSSEEASAYELLRIFVPLIIVAVVVGKIIRGFHLLLVALGLSEEPQPVPVVLSDSSSRYAAHQSALPDSLLSRTSGPGGDTIHAEIKGMNEDSARSVLVNALLKARPYGWSKDLACIHLVAEDSEDEYRYFETRENHAPPCEGDPEVTPRLDGFRVHRISGVVGWQDPISDEWRDMEALRRFRHPASDSILN